MTWDYYEKGEEYILKKEKKQEPKELLDSLGPKERKRLKKVLQSAQPTEFFGKDFTQMGELIRVLKDLKIVKDDNKLNKKMKSMDERNIDIVATATELRKDYELLYRQLRDLVYPNKKKGDEK
jgi:ABC-type phosphate transport system auxiliary subunit|tara:strand:- start:59 stop:427 length:369 start_codon:yes stop_codon:yes gene_type:complete